MDVQSQLELLSRIAGEFVGRIRGRYWKLASPFSNDQLEATALASLYETSKRWDQVRPLENFARRSGWFAFLREIRFIVGRVPESGDHIDPDSTDPAWLNQLSTPPAPTREEADEVQAAEKLAIVLKRKSWPDGTDKILLARRRFVIDLGFGKEMGRGTYRQLDQDLRPDASRNTPEKDGEWHGLLLRRQALMKYGLVRIHDS